MVGIGPFVPHHDTPFAEHPHGDADLTIACLSLMRIMLPKVLLPATTALSTIDPQGREHGILAGANVVMPNLSPKDARRKYELYNNKISTGAESSEGLNRLAEQMQSIGYQLSDGRGDHPSFQQLQALL
jgi:biotin synthase